MNDDLLSIRVRGIYATALSALLPRHGFEVVEASLVIAERLGLSTAGDAAVSLRDRADHQAVRLAGAARCAEQAARRLAALLPDAIPRPLRGSDEWEIELPGGSKAALDATRATVWPTLPGHHHLKILAQNEVDRAEASLANGRGAVNDLARDLRRRFLLPGLRTGRDIFIEHVKPFGKVISLPGRVATLEADAGERIRLGLARIFRPGGSFDSLNEPKLVGDHGATDLLEGSWVARRTYRRANGAPIGELYNIQTPVELYPDRARYLDLQVDVAAWPDGRVEIVDLPDLDEDVAAGLLSAKLAARAVAVAEGVRDTLIRGEPIKLEAWL
jgi:hypothetical protein